MAGELVRYDLQDVPTAMMSNVPYREMVLEKDGDWCKAGQAIAIIDSLRAELLAANERTRIAEEDADRLATNGFHEENCYPESCPDSGAVFACYDGCGWGKALWEHEKAITTRPQRAADREAGV